MLVTPDNVRWAGQVFAKTMEKALRGKTFRLNQPVILTVQVRGQRSYTREEAFNGSESFTVSGVFVEQDSYNKVKYVVTLKPTWPADFSSLHLDLTSAYSGFDGLMNAALEALEYPNSDLDKARKVFALADEGKVAVASAETLKDERFGSW